MYQAWTKVSGTVVYLSKAVKKKHAHRWEHKASSRYLLSSEVQIVWTWLAVLIAKGVSSQFTHLTILLAEVFSRHHVIFTSSSVWDCKEPSNRSKHFLQNCHFNTWLNTQNNDNMKGKGLCNAIFLPRLYLERRDELQPKASCTRTVLDPLSPTSDQNRISPYSISTISSRNETRIKTNIT